MAQKSSKTAESHITSAKLDDHDISILKLLQENARMTVKEIAEKISLSATPVHERIKRLENSGIIKKYIAVLDAEKLKKGLTVICYVSLKEHGKLAGSKFVKAIQLLPEVIECYSISGEFDFMLKVVEESMQTYYDFHVNKLSQIENMGNIQSVFVMGVIKETYNII